MTRGIPPLAICVRFRASALISIKWLRKNCTGSNCVAKRNVAFIKGGPINFQSVLLTTVVAIVFSVAAHAEDKGAFAVSMHELKAKTDYCKTCHGVSGQGFRGSFPMPRLAGQQPEYLENQLQAFIERRRTNPVIFNVAHVLCPSMIKTLATNFRDLNPKALRRTPKAHV